MHWISTPEMDRLQAIIEPYINWETPWESFFKEGTPDEIKQMREKLIKLAREQQEEEWNLC